MLSFELINKIIENGGSFTFYEKKDSHVVEIDCIKDLNNENFNSKNIKYKATITKNILSNKTHIKVNYTK